ncbi:lactonase family protein [Goodfellowiella coeruleoviolacea]|uniref:6-phosphogluconolactonase, cycloisomerase 2 family n=1 Tax=Goodfellowiella coeruleoviolacea TaxID=334858 RepID=A0AAE3KDI4_9PSEU|nr:lactonase family protein [Goodfellowiella coeruleoviolacea]MCP2164106.1 6-phosphogluconolactonase, cycloisomerase 2 family [Goodfellowiella coeruleoviolacea]
MTVSPVTEGAAAQVRGAEEVNPGQLVRHAFVGGYAGTETPSQGVSWAGVDPDTGALTVLGTLAEVPNPFHLALSEDGSVLYAASNVVEGRVHALKVAEDGSLSRLGSAASQGSGTVHLTVHPDGRYLLAANHDSGTVVVHPVDADGGVGEVVHSVRHLGAGPDPLAQQGPHPHMVVVDPTGERVLVPDKGTDSVHVHRFDRESGELTPHSQVHIGSGVGPRHLVFHPSGRFLYLVNELSSTVTVCGYDVATGALWTLESTSTVPPGTDMWNAASAIRLSADGQFLYAANRGHESVVTFAVEDSGRRLRRVTTQRVTEQPGINALPWDLVLDPTDRLMYVVNQLAGAVAAFRVDRGTGLLERVGEPVAVPTPACIVLR